LVRDALIKEHVIPWGFFVNGKFAARFLLGLDLRNSTRKHFRSANERNQQEGFKFLKRSQLLSLSFFPPLNSDIQFTPFEEPHVEKEKGLENNLLVFDNK